MVKYTIPMAGHVTGLEESRIAFVEYHIKVSTKKIEILKMGNR
jgi:hypothetical protein